MRLEHTKIINRSTSEVFETLVRFDEMAKYLSRLDEAYPAAEGRTEVGTTFVQKSESPGGGFQTTGEVVSLEKDRFLSYVISGGPYAGKWSFSLSAAPGGSRAYVTWDARASLLSSLLAPLYSRRRHSLLRRDLISLAMVTEDRRRNSFPGSSET